MLRRRSKSNLISIKHKADKIDKKSRNSILFRIFIIVLISTLIDFPLEFSDYILLGTLLN